MTTTRIQDYLGIGTLAARPATLALNTAAQGLYYATDTQQEFVWNGTTWTTSGGIEINIGGTITPAATISQGTNISFSGTTPNLTLSASGGGGLTIENQGTSLGSATTLNAGSGITAALSGGIATLTSSGGSGSGGGLFANLLAAQSTNPPTKTSMGYSSTVNPGASTQNNGLQGVLAVNLSGSSSDWNLFYKTTPTGNFTATIGIIFSTSYEYATFGFGFQDSSGKIQVIGFQSIGLGQWRIYLQNWNSYSSFSSNIANDGGYGAFGPGPIFFQVKVNGTTYSFNYSSDGETFFPLYSATIGSGFIAALTDILYGLNSPSTDPIAASIFYYKETTP